MFRSSAVRWLALSAIAMLLHYPPCHGQYSPSDRRVFEIIREKGQAEITISHPGARAFDHLTRNVSVSRVRENRVHVILSPLTAEWFIKGGYDYSIVETDEIKGIRTARSIEEVMEWESYPTMPQYDSIMFYFAENYPALCRLDTIGTSINGRIVYALKISDNPGTDEDEPKVFFTSTIHGNETGGFVLMLRLAGYLLSNYASDGKVRNLVDKMEIWINPLANPDGTYYGGNTITSPVRFNAAGYDLNRNFPDPAAENPPRQKETLDMMAFLAKHRFVLSASFHSGAEVVNYPWDRWQRLHADNSWFYAISREYADTVHNNSPAGYMTDLSNGITNGYAWYQIYGGRQDYVTYALNGREVTIELDKNYITPADKLADLWEYNRVSLLGYVENALYGIHGTVTDRGTGEPVPAKVFIAGHDRDNSHLYADALTGRFIRLAAPGSWDITFTADGYIDTVVYNVVAEPRRKTFLAVGMTHIRNPVDTTNPSAPLLYPNPAVFYVYAVMPEKLRGNINIRIYNTTGAILSDYNRMAYEGSPVILDVRAFPAGVYTVVFKQRATGISSYGRFVVARRF
ncbi:MAG: hypothetical protein K0B05_08650 [Bacteroidales bacterium]|nr:hypothetical protein [Bacteroidales bacterium]